MMTLEVTDYRGVPPVAYGDIAQLIGYGLEMELPGASDSSSLQLLPLSGGAVTCGQRPGHFAISWTATVRF